MRPFKTSLAIIVLALATLTGCGFQLRQPPAIGFAAVYLSSANPSAVANDLRRELSQGKTRLTPNLASADAHVRVLREDRDKLIYTLSGAGRVREYQLRLKLSYEVKDARDRALIEPAEITLTRLITYDDRAITAKEQEEQFLFRDMQSEATQQILRRLALLKPAA
jgi:LPS-assembly lipoprotein